MKISQLIHTRQVLAKLCQECELTDEYGDEARLIKSIDLAIWDECKSVFGFVQAFAETAVMVGKPAEEYRWAFTAASIISKWAYDTANDYHQEDVS